MDKIFSRIKKFGGHSIQGEGVSVVHPDILTVGGAMEIKTPGNMCEKYGVAMANYTAESPIACMAAVYAAVTIQNILWWNDIAIGIENPLFNDKIY